MKAVKREMTIDDIKKTHESSFQRRPESGIDAVKSLAGLLVKVSTDKTGSIVF